MCLWSESNPHLNLRFYGVIDLIELYLASLWNPFDIPYTELIQVDAVWYNLI